MPKETPKTKKKSYIKCKKSVPAEALAQKGGDEFLLIRGKRCFASIYSPKTAFPRFLI